MSPEKKDSECRKKFKAQYRFQQIDQKYTHPKVTESKQRDKAAVKKKLGSNMKYKEEKCMHTNVMSGHVNVQITKLSSMNM